MLTDQLFEGQHIRFAPPDADRDAEIVSKWTHDLDYLRLLSTDIAKPLSPAQIKKQYEEMDKGRGEAAMPLTSPSVLRRTIA